MWALLLALAVILLWPTSAVTYQAAAVQVPSQPKIWTKESINELISQKALAYGVNAGLMRHIVSKESTYDPARVGDKNYLCKRTGLVSPSYGLVQINLCFHDVTIDEAKDPEFAINFLAKHLAHGDCYLWTTCSGYNEEVR